MRIIIYTLLIFMIVSLVQAHDYVPGKIQDHPILLRGGTVYTVSDGIKENSDVLFNDGRIVDIGENIIVPENTEIINVTGKHIYPGLIAAYSYIGLVEIGSVRATNDRREIGTINPNILAHIAYNPDSEIIPSVRSNGITTALIVPGGRLITGTSSLLNLDGWTWEDATEKLNVGMHLIWPAVKAVKGYDDKRSLEEIKKELRENREVLYEAFDDAKVYYLAQQADASIKKDLRWDAMVPVFDKEIPVFIQANDYRQIDQAVQFSKDYDFNMILVGGRDAWMCPELLKDNKIPVIVAWTQALPGREDDGYDLRYSLPARLYEAGVKFCMAQAGGGWSRNLPFQAGQAIAFGLPKEEALRALTLSVAEILDVDQNLGSLEVGKKATIIVSDGDIFDILTHKIIYEFIEGKKVDLNNKHKELYEKYRQKSL
ncbi:MAG: amidohydrolase family protein [candidate division Zixibacteria bacterium]|nr:amidohydrolase family protein [candidate division Zixibacteria bacterium]